MYVPGLVFWTGSWILIWNLSHKWLKKWPGELLNFTIYFHHKLEQLIAMADIHSSIFDKVMSQRSFLSMCIIHLAVIISSETVVLLQWRMLQDKFGFINWVDKCKLQWPFMRAKAQAYTTWRIIWSHKYTYLIDTEKVFTYYYWLLRCNIMIPLTIDKPV